MALTRLISPLLLLSLVVIASANPDYNTYTKNPETYKHFYPEKDSVEHGHYQSKDHGKLVDLDVDIDNENIVDKLHSGDRDDDKSHGYNHRIPEKKSYDTPKPKEYVIPTKPYHNQEKNTYYNDYRVREGLVPEIDSVGIEGIVLCKSGKAITPIQGAIANIKCPVTSYSYDKNGYNKAEYYSISTPKTNEKGCFLATMQVEELVEKSIDVRHCKVYLEYSPLESCIVAPIEAAPISYYSTLNHIMYFSAGSLSYTPKNSVPTYEPAPKNSVPTYEPAPKNSVPTYELAPKNSVPTYEPAPKNSVPTYEPAPKNSVPTYEPATKNLVLTYEPAPKNSVPTYEPAPKNSSPTYEPASKNSVPTTEPASKYCPPPPTGY